MRCSSYIISLLILVFTLVYVYNQQLIIHHPIASAISNPPKPTYSSKNPTATFSSSAYISADDRRVVSSYLGPGSSLAEKKEFGEVIVRNSIATTKLDISNCQPNPLVIKMKKGTEVKVINNDYVVRSVFFGPNQQYDIPREGNTSFKANLHKGINLYRCNLDNQNPIVGAFLLED